jgi:hypothetical protein
MENRPAPEFGPNGAVLNSAAMTEALKQAYLHEGARHRRAPPQRIGWGWRALLMFPLVTIWVAPDPAGLGPLWFRLAATGAAAAFFVRSFWPFRKWPYRLWGAPYAFALLANQGAFYLRLYG